MTKVRQANRALRQHDAFLLPTAAHPLSLPGPKEADRGAFLGDPRSANLSFACLRLPFHGDAEFAKVHAAVRMLLPILPAIGASSPVLNGEPTAALDGAVEAIMRPDPAFPQLVGPFVPEAVFSQEEYYREVFRPMAQGLPGPDAAFDHLALNGRGAVALFDEGIIEIRMIGMQECVAADLAVASMVLAVLRALVGGRWVSSYLQRAWSEDDLARLLRDVVVHGGDAVITNSDYLLMYGLMKQDEMTAAKLWQHLFVDLYAELDEGTRLGMAHIVEHGCLAARIRARTGPSPEADRVVEVYRDLAEHLQADRLFI